MVSAQIPVPALILRGLAAACLVAALAGCSDDLKPLPPEPSVGTPPVTPPGTPPETTAVAPETVVRDLVSSWNDRDVSRYAGLFTADYEFVFAPSDTSSSHDRFGRGEELTFAQHLFVGGGVEPPATAILFVINPVLVAAPDSRPGKDPTVHREIATGFDLTVTTAERLHHFSGTARFFVVRGDSAGSGADANRWYVERWVDGSVPGPLPAGIQAGRPRTIGDLKLLYLP